MIRAHRRCPRQKRNRASAEPPALHGRSSGRDEADPRDRERDGGRPALRRELLERARRGPLQVFVVCPALNSRLRHWLSDEDGARTRAEQRLADSLAALAREDRHRWPGRRRRSGRRARRCFAHLRRPRSDRLDAPAGAFQLARARCHRPSASGLAGRVTYVVASSKSPPWPSTSVVTSSAWSTSLSSLNACTEYLVDPNRGETTTPRSFKRAATPSPSRPETRRHDSDPPLVLARCEDLGAELLEPSRTRDASARSCARTRSIPTARKYSMAEPRATPAP